MCNRSTVWGLIDVQSLDGVGLICNLLTGLICNLLTGLICNLLTGLD